MKINNLHELMSLAIAIAEPTLVHFNNCNVDEVLNPMPECMLKSTEMGFNREGGNMSFVKNGIQYVIPNFDGIENLLLKEGFKKVSLFVPFTAFSYPVKEQKHWEELLEKFRAS